MTERAQYRIGELERRTGVAGATLRAWERRYGVLSPTRTEGGHRLYSDADVERVRRVQQLVDEGWSVSSAAEAVRSGQDPVVISATEPTAPGSSPAPVDRLLDAVTEGVRRWDQSAVDRALDDTFSLLDVPAALDRVVLPAVRRSAQGWRDDPGVIAREHFLSNLVRPRLRRLIGLGAGRSAAAVAAAPETDEHDIGLLAASAVIASCGVSVRYLGPRTPVPALERTVAEVAPRLVLVSSVFRTAADSWLATEPQLGDARVILGGAGFVADDAHRLRNASVHEGDLTTLAERSIQLLHR